MRPEAYNMPMKSYVYVIDDEESMRTAVSLLLHSVGYPAEAFGSTQEFFSFNKPDVPSCLILDVRLKGQSGLAMLEQIATGNMTLPIIFMTAHGDIEMSVKAMKAGALDFLAKPFRDQDLLDAVEAALAKDTERRCQHRSMANLQLSYTTLTRREREVMSLVMGGLMNKHIAAEMNLSEITVKVHRAQAMKKMHARSLADFVLKAQMLGLKCPQSVELRPTDMFDLPS